MNRLAPLAIAVSLLLCAPAQAQRRGGKSTRKPVRGPSGPVFVAQSPDDPAEGEIDGRNYTNKYFGFRIAFPEGWFVLNDVGKAEAKERAKTVIKPLGSMDKQALDQAVERTFHMLFVRQYVDATPERPSAILVVMGELLSVMNLSPLQYAQAMKSVMMTRSTIKVEPVGDITTERLAGEESARLMVKVAAPGGIEAKQEYYVTIRRGYAVVFLLTYVDEEQHALLAESLNSVTFQQPGQQPGK
jgi:hypothetical protein